MIYIDIITGTYGNAADLVFVEDGGPVVAEELENMSDSEIIEFGHNYGQERPA